MFKLIFSMRTKSKMRQQIRISIFISFLMSTFLQVQGANIFEADTCSPVCWNQFLQRSDASAVLQEITNTLRKFGPQSPEMITLLQSLINESESLAVGHEVAVDTKMEKIENVSPVSVKADGQSIMTPTPNPIIFNPPPMEPELLEAVPIYIEKLMTNQDLESRIPPAELNNVLNKVLTFSDTSFFDLSLVGSLSSASLSTESLSCSEEISTTMSKMSTTVINRQQTVKKRTVLKKKILRFLQQIIEQRALPAEFTGQIVDYIEYLGQDIVSASDDELTSFGQSVAYEEIILIPNHFINNEENSPDPHFPALDPYILNGDPMQSVQQYVTDLLSNPNLMTDIPQEELGFILNKVLTGSDKSFIESLPLSDSISYSTDFLGIDDTIMDTDTVIIDDRIAMGMTKTEVVDYLQQIIERGSLPIDLVNRLYGYVEFITKDDQYPSNHNDFVPLSLGSDLLQMLPAYINDILSDNTLMPALPTDLRSKVLNEIFTGSDLSFFDSLPESISQSSLTSSSDYAMNDVTTVVSKKHHRKTKISKKRIVKYLKQIIEKEALPSQMLERLGDYLDFIRGDGQYKPADTVVKEIAEEKPKGKFTLAITGIDAVDIVKPRGKSADKLTLKLNGGGMKGLLEKLGSFSNSASNEENEKPAANLPEYKFAFPFDQDYMQTMYPNIDFNSMTKYFNTENFDGGGMDTDVLFESPLAEMDLEEKKITENADLLHDNWLDVVGELNLLMKSELDKKDVDELSSIVKELEGFMPQKGINSSDNLPLSKIKKIISRLNGFFKSRPNLKNFTKFGEIVKGLKTNLKFSEKFFKKVKSITMRKTSIKKIINKKKFSGLFDNIQEKLKKIPELLKFDDTVVDGMFGRIMSDLENFMAWNPTDIIEDNYMKLLSKLHSFMNGDGKEGGEMEFSGEIMNEVQAYFKEEVNPRSMAFHSEAQITESIDPAPLLIDKVGFNDAFIDDMETCHHLISELETLIESRSNSLFSFKYKKITTKLRKYIHNLKLYGTNGVCAEEYHLALTELGKYITNDPTIVFPDKYQKLISDITYSIDMMIHDPIDVDPFIERSVDALENFFVSKPEIVSRVEYSSKITKIRRFMKSIKRYGKRSINTVEYSTVLQELVEDMAKDTSIVDTQEISYILTEISDFIENPNYRVYDIDPNFSKLLTDIEYFMSSSKEIEFPRYVTYITKMYMFVHEVERYGVDVVDYERYNNILAEFLEEVHSDTSITGVQSELYVELISQIGEQMKNPLQGSYEIDSFIERSIADIENFIQVNTEELYRYKYHLHIIKLRKYVTTVKQYGLQTIESSTYQNVLTQFVEEIKMDRVVENVSLFEDLVAQTSTFITDSSYGLYEADPFIVRSIETLESYLMSEPKAQYSKYSVHITKIYRYISEVKRYGVQSVDTDVYLSTLDQIVQEISADMSIIDFDKYSHLISQVSGYIDASSKRKLNSVDPFIERSISMLETYIESKTKILHTTRYKKIITKLYKYISDVKVYGTDAVDINSYQTILNQLSDYISTDSSIENSEIFKDLVNDISVYMSDTSYGTYEFDSFLEKSISDLENYLQTNSQATYKTKYSRIIRKLYKHVSTFKRYGKNSFDTEDYKSTVAELQSTIAMDQNIENVDFYMDLVGEISEVAVDKEVSESFNVDPFIERAIAELEQYLQSSTGLSYTTRYSVHITKLYKYISDFKRVGVASIDHEYYMKTLSELMEAVHQDSSAETSEVTIDLLLQISDYFDTPDYVTYDIDAYELLMDDLEMNFKMDTRISNSPIYLESISQLRNYTSIVKKFGRSSIQMENFKVTLSELEKQMITDLGNHDQREYIYLISQIAGHFEETDSLTHELESYNMVVTELENILISDKRIKLSIKHSSAITKLHKYMSDVRRYGLTSMNTEHYIEVITQLSSQLFSDLQGDLELYSDVFTQIFSFFRTPSYVSYELDEYSSLVSDLENFFKTEVQVVYTKKTSVLIRKLYKYTSVVKKYGIGAVDTESYRILLNELSNEVFTSVDDGFVTSKLSEITSQISDYFETTPIDSGELNNYKSLITNFEKVLLSDSITTSSSKYTILMEKLHKYASDIERYGISAVDVSHYQSILSELSTEISTDPELQNNHIFQEFVSQVHEFFDPVVDENHELDLYQMLVSNLESVLGSSINSAKYSILMKKMSRYISDVKRFGIVSVNHEHYTRVLDQISNAIMLDNNIDLATGMDLVKQLEGFFIMPDYVSIDLEPYCDLITDLENSIITDSSVLYATKYSLKVTKLQKYVKRIRKYGVTAVDMSQYKELLTSLSNDLSADDNIEFAGKYTNMISQISDYFDAQTDDINDVDPYQMIVSNLEHLINQDQTSLVKFDSLSIIIQKLYKYSSDVKFFGASAVDLRYYQEIVSKFQQELIDDTNIINREYYMDLLSQISDYFGTPSYIHYNSDPYSSALSELDSYLRVLPSYETEYLEYLTKLNKYSSDVEVHGKHHIDNHYYNLVISQLWNTITRDTNVENVEVFENVILQISDHFDTSCHIEFNLGPYQQAVSELETFIQKTTVTRKVTSTKRTKLIRKLYMYINDVETYGIESVDPDHYNVILSELREDLVLEGELDEEKFSDLITPISDYFVTPNYVSYNFEPYVDLLTRLDLHLSTYSTASYHSTYSQFLEKLNRFTDEAEKYGIGVVDKNSYQFTLSQLSKTLTLDGSLQDFPIHGEIISELSDYYEANDPNPNNLDHFDFLVTELEDRFLSSTSISYSKKYTKYVRKLRKYVLDVKKYGSNAVDTKYFDNLLTEMMNEVSNDPNIKDVIWYENSRAQISELLVIPENVPFNVDPYETLISSLEDTISSIQEVSYTRKYSIKIKKLRKYSKIVKKYGVSAVDSHFYANLLDEVKADLVSDPNLVSKDNILGVISDISSYIETPSFFLHTTDPFTSLISEFDYLIQTEINVFQATAYFPLIKNLYNRVSAVRQFGLKALDGEDYLSDIKQLQKLTSEQSDVRTVGKYSTLLMLISKAFDTSCGVLPDSEQLINLLFDVENHISAESYVINHNQYFTSIGNLYDFLLGVHLFGTQNVNRKLYQDMVSQISNLLASDINIHDHFPYIGSLSRVSTYLTCNSLFPYSTENFRSLMGKLEELIVQEPVLIYRYKYFPIIHDLYNYIADFQYLGTEGTRSVHYRNILIEFRASISIEPQLRDTDIYLQIIEEILEEIDRPFNFSREVKPFMKLISELEKMIELEPDLINTIYYRKRLLNLRHYISHRHAVKNKDLELDYISVIVDDIVKQMSMEPNVVDQTTFNRLVSRLRKHVRVSQRSRLSLPVDETDIDEITGDVTPQLQDNFIDDDRLAMEFGLSMSSPDPFSNVFHHDDLGSGSEHSSVVERRKILSIIRRLSRSGSVSPEIMSRLNKYYQSKFGDVDLFDGFGDDSFEDDLDMQSLMLMDNPMIGDPLNGVPDFGFGSPMLPNMGMQDPNFLFDNPVIIQPVPVFVSSPSLHPDPVATNPEDQEAFLSVMGAETIAKLIPPSDSIESYTLHIEGIDSLEQLEALRAAVENNGLLIAGLDTMAVESPPEVSENIDSYIALDALAEMYEEMTVKAVEPEIVNTEYELLSDLQIQNELINIEEALETSNVFEDEVTSLQEMPMLPPHLISLVEPMVLRKSTHFISMNAVFGGEEEVVPLLNDRYLSVFGEYVTVYG